MATLAELKGQDQSLADKEKMLTEKLGRLRSGEMDARKSNDGQEGAIARNEDWLVGVKREREKIAQTIQSLSTKGTK